MMDVESFHTMGLNKWYFYPHVTWSRVLTHVNLIETFFYVNVALHFFYYMYNQIVKHYSSNWSYENELL